MSGDFEVNASVKFSMYDDEDRSADGMSHNQIEVRFPLAYMHRASLSQLAMNTTKTIFHEMLPGMKEAEPLFDDSEKCRMSAMIGYTTGIGMGYRVAEEILNKIAASAMQDTYRQGLESFNDISADVEPEIGRLYQLHTQKGSCGSRMGLIVEGEDAEGFLVIQRKPSPGDTTTGVEKFSIPAVVFNMLFNWINDQNATSELN